MAAACAHDGFHSIVARYDHEGAELIFLRTCDGCGVELAEVGRQDYRPRYEPLFDRHGLREVSRLVDVQSPVPGDPICEQL
jgi:hypothetical protein